MGEKWPMIFCLKNAQLPRNIQGSFTCRKSTTLDRRLYFPSEGKRAEGFFALKNPTASVGFEPTNLATKGQYATSRPPKLLHTDIQTYIHTYICVKGSSFVCFKMLPVILIWCSSIVYVHTRRNVGME